MDEFILCDLLEARGPDWGNHTQTQVRKLVKKIHLGTNLIGMEPNLYGFVGTRVLHDEQMGDVVGGYFAVQYDDKAFHYDKKKKLNIIRVYPFARMFFVFFARSGRCLLQNTRFVGIPLTYTDAKVNFQVALNRLFEECKMHKLISLAFVRDELSDACFKSEMKHSTRVSRIKVATPAARRLPGTIKYYNPRVERNEIIRESHLHDYSYLKRIELEVNDDADIRDLHLVDVMRSGRTEEMEFMRGEEKVTLRRKVLNRFSFHIDMEAEELPEAQFHTVIDHIRQVGVPV